MRKELTMKEKFKDGFSGKEFDSPQDALNHKLARVSKASDLLKACVDRINKKQKLIHIICKTVFKKSKSKKIRKSIYGDKRFPAYILALTDSTQHYYVRDKVTRELTKDGNSGGVIPEALLEFKFIRKEKSTK